MFKLWVPFLYTSVSSGGDHVNKKQFHVDEQRILSENRYTDALEALRTRGITQPLQPEDIANAICYAIEQPEWASVNEIIIRPTAQVS